MKKRMPDDPYGLPSEPHCPYCGDAHPDAWELDDDAVVECGSCEKTFNCYRNVYVSYTTEPAEPAFLERNDEENI